MNEVMDYQNKRMQKQGLVIIPGKKFIWLELWKTKFMEQANRPLISLIGRDPIVDYDSDTIEELLVERDRELKDTYKRRYNIKYDKLGYLTDTYKSESIRRQKDTKD